MEIQQLLEEAKQAHLNWLKRAEDLTNNSLNEEIPPVDSNSCKFGKLMHSPELQSLEDDLFDEIDTTHFLVHDMYKNIYDLLANNPSPSEKDLADAHDYFDMLKDASDAMLELLEELKSHFE